MKAPSTGPGLFSEDAQHESCAQPIIAVKFVGSVDLNEKVYREPVNGSSQCRSPRNGGGDGASGGQAWRNRGAEVLWEDAGHRAAMQVAADRVEKLHGRELRIIEADQAAVAPDRQHAGEVHIGALGSELVKGPRKFGEAGALGDDQPVKTDRIPTHHTSI